VHLVECDRVPAYTFVDRESAWRDTKRLQARLYHAKLCVQAAIEDIDFRTPRGLERSLVLRLAECRWINESVNVNITGPTGSGKTWLSCAFGHRAARDDHSVLYTRTPRLLEDLAIARADGRYPRLLASLAKVRLLILDDWAITPMTADHRRDVLEVVEDRCGRVSTLIAGQIPVADWHSAIGDAKLADAILDRLVHSAHHIEIKGESMRKRYAHKTLGT
jgi:DNA replication protein DnaC